MAFTVQGRSPLQLLQRVFGPSVRAIDVGLDLMMTIFTTTWEDFTRMKLGPEKLDLKNGSVKDEQVIESSSKYVNSTIFLSYISFCFLKLVSVSFLSPAIKSWRNTIKPWSEIHAIGHLTYTFAC